jgi:hypothetical protein
MSERRPTKEQEILQVMRKVLAAVIKDTTPEHKGLRHPLSDRTIEDIRQCFVLISARERELAEEAGVTAFAKPVYPDTPRKAQVVALKPLKRSDDTEAS